MLTTIFNTNSYLAFFPNPDMHGLGTFFQVKKELQRPPARSCRKKKHCYTVLLV